MKRISAQLMAFALSVFSVTFTAPTFSEDGVARSTNAGPIPPSQERSSQLVTSRGTIHVGMSEKSLNDLLEENNRKFVPSYILNKGWLIYRDITSNNPNDTITFYTTSGRVSGWDRSYVPSPENKGSRYECRPGECIEIWFFPKEKARWDGSTLSILDWNKLVRIQKVMFTIEYINRLNEEQKTNILVDVNKYILAMDYYASTFPKEAESVAATKGIDSLLLSDGKARALPKDKGAST